MRRQVGMCGWWDHIPVTSIDANFRLDRGEWGTGHDFFPDLNARTPEEIFAEQEIPRPVARQLMEGNTPLKEVGH